MRSYCRPRTLALADADEPIEADSGVDSIEKASQPTQIGAPAARFGCGLGFCLRTAHTEAGSGQRALAGGRPPDDVARSDERTTAKDTRDLGWLCIPIRAAFTPCRSINPFATPPHPPTGHRPKRWARIRDLAPPGRPSAVSGWGADWDGCITSKGCWDGMDGGIPPPATPFDRSHANASPTNRSMPRTTTTITPSIHQSNPPALNPNI